MNSQLQNNNPASNPFLLHGKSKYSVQPKLTINTPGDIYEQEADAMADRVIRISPNEVVKPGTGLIGKSLQRKCAHCEEEEKRRKPIMRKAEGVNSGMPVSSSFAASLSASKGGGSPLPKGTRSFMENAFSTDFSAVRIHTDRHASEMSKGINAKAFTHGNDIYFNCGEFQPNTKKGKHLLGHELVHVEQQRRGKSILNAKNSEIVQRNPSPLARETVKFITSIKSAGSFSIIADEMERFHYSSLVIPPVSPNRRVVGHKVDFIFTTYAWPTSRVIYNVHVRMNYETDGLGIGNISFSILHKNIAVIYDGSLNINLTPSDISNGTYSQIRLSFDYSFRGNALVLWSGESGNFSHRILSNGLVRNVSHSSGSMKRRIYSY